MLERSHFLTVIIVVALATPVFSQIKTIVGSEVDSSSYSLKPGSSFAAAGSSQSPASSVRERKRLVSDLAEALNVIRSQHVNSPGQTELVKSSIEGSLRALDPHSSYFDSKEFEDFMADQESEYSGIGATIGSFPDRESLATYVLGTRPGSPSRTADLAFGDKILAVNGTEVTGLDSEVVRDVIRGAEGTVVRLKAQKNTTGEIKEINLKRKLLEQPSIPEHFILGNGVGYIGMTEGFNYSTEAELRSSLKALKNQGMASLILDLRGNPGGLLAEAVGVAEQFLPVGNIVVSQHGRRTYDNRIWRSKNPSPETMPLIVLVDRDTASASEIVAGALQDHDRALILGERTFGKGLVQNVINLPSGGAITLTGARYYTPSGRCIQRDYSSIGSYDYFNSRTNTARFENESKTDGNRIVYGGNGIEPDEISQNPKTTSKEREIMDQLFFFIRDYVRGNVAGEFRKVNYSEGSTGPRLREQLLTHFQQFLAKKGSGKINIEPTFAAAVSSRALYYILLASSADHPERELVFADPLIAKAIHSLPRARQMAESSRPDLRKADFLVKPRVSQEKRPAGSHRRRVENRRN